MWPAPLDRELVRNAWLGDEAGTDGSASTSLVAVFEQHMQEHGQIWVHGCYTIDDISPANLCEIFGRIVHERGLDLALDWLQRISQPLRANIRMYAEICGIEVVDVLPLTTSIRLIRPDQVATLPHVPESPRDD